MRQIALTLTALITFSATALAADKKLYYYSSTQTFCR